MKVKCINRSEEAYTRERTQDLQKVHRNLDPALHPFEKATEYTRALNAAKLDRVFAKPFICALPHPDGITCLGRNPRRLNSLLVGTADGGLRIWDVAAQRCLRRLTGALPPLRQCLHACAVSRGVPAPCAKAAVEPHEELRKIRVVQGTPAP